MKYIGRMSKETTGFALTLLFVFSFTFIYFDTGLCEDEKGLVTFVDGQARKQKIGDEYWSTAKENTEVTSGERVKTLIRTRAEIKMAELDIIRLAPKTTVDIVKLYQEGKDKKRETQVDLQEGDIWASIGSLDASSSLELNTAVANATVKGTVFRVNVGEDNSTELKVYKGEVDVSGKTKTEAIDSQAPEGEKKSLAPKQISPPKQVEGPKEVTMKEWTVIVREMQKIIISADSKVMYHGKFSGEDRDEKTDWVKWNKDRDRLVAMQTAPARDAGIEEKPAHEPDMRKAPITPAKEDTTGEKDRNK
jgi:hypothetical protein